MASSNFPNRHDLSQASSRPARAPGLWRLGMTSTMSPSLVASTSPSSEAISAFAPTTNWGPSIHHSTSTPQMFGADQGGVSSRFASGPSAFGMPSDQSGFGTTTGGQAQDLRTTPNTDGGQSERNHVVYQADSYGSPNRYIGKSPNPYPSNERSTSRNHRPEPLGFGNIGDSLRVNGQQMGTEPKSAPAQVKSFDQFANIDGQPGSNQNLFDDRWLQHPEEMYVTPTHRTSILTISPDKDYPSPSSTRLRHAATYTDLLQAQLGSNAFDENVSRGLGPLGVHSKSQGQTRRSSPVPPRHDNNTLSHNGVGRGYETLTSYVEVASSGRPHSSVVELDQLMSTLIELRGDGDTLPSMQHYGRGKLRQILYQRVFGSDDGSSRLSRANPTGLIDVAGTLVPRQHLHDEIVCFLEDQLNAMTNSPELRRAGPAVREGDLPQHNHTTHQFDGHGEFIEQQEHNLGRPSIEPSPAMVSQAHVQTDRGPSPMPNLKGLNLGEPQNATAPIDISHQPMINPGISQLPNFSQQQAFQPGSWMQGGHLPQGLAPLPYGQSLMEIQQQQYIAYLQQQAQQSMTSIPPNLVISRNGMVSGPHPLTAPSVTFIPGRQGMAQPGQLLPYGQPFLPGQNFAGPQYAGPMMPGNFMPNPQMVFNPYLSNTSTWSAPRLHSSLGRQFLTSSRTSSPANPHRRHVVPEVAPLPYRPGSDDMYPHAIGGMSVKMQELTRDGQPSFATASDPKYLPFAENAREAKVAEWGVMKITNIPYSVTKQEVYGILGRNAKIVTPELGVGIHIIMDRPTGKTMDCFVEYFSYGDALASYNRCVARGPNMRLGDRIVNVAMSSQDELMREMFPRAKNCTWRDGRPVITESQEAYNTGFKTFLTNEELLQMVTHAEKPHRFPWFAVERYTIKTRDEIFRQALNLTTLLANQLNRGNEGFEHNLSQSLLTELLYAGLNAPAFSEQQRWQLCRAAHPVDQKIRMSPLVPYWPFQVLGRKACMDEDLVKFYAACLKRHPHTAINDTTNPYFGTWTTQSNESLGLTTIGKIGAREMEMVKDMLRDVLA
ncbi:MAG: hypothetical protein Q9218_004261 [Villophora microphyllina]